MDGGASRGFSGGGLPPRPTVASTRRRPPFVAPHSRPATSSSLDANLPRRQEHPSPGGGRMPSLGASGSGSSLPRRLPNDPPALGPRALSFTEPHAATWDTGSSTTSAADVYEVADDDFSPNHWTPDYSQQRSSSSHYFTNMMTQEKDDDLQLLNQQDATPSTGGKGVQICVLEL